MTESPRPFAAQARQLCRESDEHHEKVWFCETCRMLEQRLTPIHMLPGIAEIMDDADITITYHRCLLTGEDGEL
jgi:hypothetical protein